MSPFSLPLFSLLILFITMITGTTQPYKATDYFFLDCGSSSTNTYSQKWDRDNKDNFFPYSTTRILKTTSFTYTFLVTKGPKFLRLYFNPDTYSSRNPNPPFFSVSSNGYSLLTNFSASLTTSFLAKTHSSQVIPYFVKEFLIHVNNTQILNVTFTPSPNSYAFINAIEVASMPENLYFNAKTPKYINQLKGPVIGNNTALENIYRLNMGGGQISGCNDTGMFRSWDPDNNYIYRPGTTQVYDNPIRYTMDTPNYTAPELVYQTQRSMGKRANKYNLTWILPVDSGFYYMLRLHFCNIIPRYTEIGQVVFTIFINNQTAEQDADLFYWTQGSGYPVYKDYIVFVNDLDGHQSRQDLWLAMHPSPYKHQYADAYLNGLEVFKLSKDHNLSSPNPKLSLDNLQQSSIIEGNNKTPLYAIIIGVCGILVLLSIVLIVLLQKRGVKHHNTTCDQQSQAQISSDATLPSNRCRRFTLQEVKTATNEFNDNCCIGGGGFGKVYKGYMDNATTTVAVKRLNLSSSQGLREFITEILLLSILRHVHLVSMIGYCEDDGEMVLVYEYMAHGTLQEHLYNTNKPPLSWKRRLDIRIGAAKGLHYLHSCEKRAIIHRDVKSTNILLDENWVVKVSDFGLSKLGSKDPLKAHVSTAVKGSFGYIDPEYCRTKQLTEKSDVYSFGVVLFEVLCARPAVVQCARDEQVSLAEWAKSCNRKGTLQEIIDPKLRGEIAPGCLRKFGEVASSCLHEEGRERPAMEEVVWGLQFALELQEWS
ncbi:putative protein kinase RLK-Pelle-CrRLK1L-1 family [Helianthus annuus]|nr:putative protein kinase RLK-Pelle-CrRLK1L-1 family [Helianthus annuus]